MEYLFPVATILPAGFRYVPDFLTREQESELCDTIAKIRLHSFKFQGYEAKRKVASFGYDYSFDNRSLSKGQDIPSEFHTLLENVSRQLEMEQNDFAELLVTEYPVGSVINWHRDAPPFEIIAGISLRADCTFRLRPYDKARQGRKSIISFPVKRRSLYILQGSARTDWQHSISPVSDVRYSITLRTLRHS